MNWELFKDNQRFRISIPVGKLSVKKTEVLMRQLNKVFINKLMKERKLKIDKIKEKINQKSIYKFVNIK